MHGGWNSGDGCEQGLRPGYFFGLQTVIGLGQCEEEVMRELACAIGDALVDQFLRQIQQAPRSEEIEAMDAGELFLTSAQWELVPLQFRLDALVGPHRKVVLAEQF